MKVVLQRVKKASVEVDKKIVGLIEKGYLLLVGFTHEDSKEDIEYITSKISKLRVFEDANEKMNLSINDINGSILSVSQFTLYASTKKGNRPSFTKAMEPVLANTMYEKFNDSLRSKGLKVQTGLFGAKMEVSLVNDGPVTIIMNSRDDSNERKS